MQRLLTCLLAVYQPKSWKIGIRCFGKNRLGIHIDLFRIGK
jgi:hypothetical protein